LSVRIDNPFSLPVQKSSSGGSTGVSFQSRISPVAQQTSSVTSISGRSVVAQALGGTVSPRSTQAQVELASGGAPQPEGSAEMVQLLDKMKKMIGMNCIFDAGNMPVVERE